MSSPRTTPAGAPRARRIAAAIIAAFVLSCLCAVGVSGLAAADDQLKEAKHELRDAKAHVRKQSKRIRKLQRQLNGIATRISRTQARMLEAEQRIAKLEKAIAAQRVRAALLQSKLDERNREAYMFGGAPVLYLLTATSAAEAASRMSFLTEMNRRDAILAGKVQDAQSRLARAEGDVFRARQMLDLSRLALKRDQRALARKMAASRQLRAELSVRVSEIQYEISKMRPFAVCPLGGPHAIADDFGIVVHHPKDEGGTHVHQGNDIYAAMGVPILAPFDGTAVTATNPIGGLAVKVYGEYGYVYNAHLSAFGKLGPVRRGDVIGYVGATGNAGGPHDHFEWHPGNGDAVDPHGYLLLVCDPGALPF